MSVEIFRKMVQALEADANELLGEGRMPGLENPAYALLVRICGLEKGEQEIVMQTVDALIDGMDKHR